MIAADRLTVLLDVIQTTPERRDAEAAYRAARLHWTDTDCPQALLAVRGAVTVAAALRFAGPLDRREAERRRYRRPVAPGRRLVE